MNPATLLFNQVHDYFHKEIILREITPQGLPYYHALMRQETGEEIGLVRLFQGKGPVESIVTTSLKIDELNMTSYMLMAFTAADTTIPHFAFDVISSPDHNAFHVDFLPRMDMGIHPSYTQEVFEPLSPALDDFISRPEFAPAQASRLLRSMLTPWMGSFQSDQKALHSGSTLVEAYLKHWDSLQRNGVADHGQSKADLAERDREFRGSLYNEEADALWAFLKTLLGEESRDLIIGLLRGEHPPTARPGN